MEFLSFDPVTLVAALVSIIAFIVTFIRTGSVKKALQNLNLIQGVTNMTTRAPDYHQSANENDESIQSFENTRTDYVLNRHTNELEEKPEKIDLQSLINSAVDTALDRVLQKLMPDGSEIPDTIETDYENSIGDLDDLAQAMDIAEEYRERLGLPLEMSVSDIYKRVGEYSSNLLEQIKTKQGGNNNVTQKEDRQAEKQAPIQEHSEESA